MHHSKALFLSLLATAAPAPVLAQQTTLPDTGRPDAAATPAAADASQPPAAGSDPAAAADAVEAAPDATEGEEEEEGEEIVVTGVRRERGAVIGDIPPEVQLDRREIRALGASNVAELLEAIAPQTRSGRGRGEGRPVVLLNGRRISGFSEIRDIPPEAIVRVDVLPEEVALKYGYRADQRVVNFVLRRNFRAVTAEADVGLATEGGREVYGGDLDYLRINPGGRLNLDVEYRRSGALLESERNIGGELAPFRTLLPQTERFSFNGTINRTLFGNVSSTLNGRFEANDSESRFGRRLDGSENPLRRESDSRNAHLGLALNGDILPWRWSLTANYDRDRTVTLTDPRTDPAAARDRALSTSSNANAELLFNGPLFDLPAGNVNSSIRAGFAMLDFESETLRSGLESAADLSRDRGTAQVNIDVPIASRRNDFLAAIGNLSANFNAEIERLSDFGTLRTLGGGLTWSPITQVNLIASFTDEEGAPGVQQLGNPLIQTPNVPVFDFVRGETVEVTTIEGGNSSLRADNRQVLKLGLTLRPLAETDLSLIANYTDTSIRNPIQSFPAITSQIEAAFPERFVRDLSGRLVSVDTRPVNFARSDRKEMRWGINYSMPIGPQPPAGGFRGRSGAGRSGGPGGAAAAGGQGQPPAEGQARPAPGGQGEEVAAAPAGRRAGAGGRFGGGGFGGRGGFGGGRGGRLQFGLYHTWRFQDELLIREGLPELDLLNGDALGSRGGRPRHEIEFQSSLSRNGFGGRLTGNWQSGTNVLGGQGADGGTSDLRFSDLMTVNLRLFADLGAQRPLVQQAPWLRGTRVSLVVDNVFDSRLRVTDAAGATPVSYLPARLDPLGRSVRISIRKLFF